MMEYMPTTAPVPNAASPKTGRAAPIKGVEAAKAVPDATEVATPTPPDVRPVTAPATSKPFKILVPRPQAGEKYRSNSTLSVSSTSYLKNLISINGLLNISSDNNTLTPDNLSEEHSHRQYKNILFSLTSVAVLDCNIFRNLI